MRRAEDFTLAAEEPRAELAAGNGGRRLGRWALPKRFNNLVVSFRR